MQIIDFMVDVVKTHLDLNLNIHKSL